MSFAHLCTESRLRAAATVSVVTTVALGGIGDGYVHGAIIVIRTSGRTVGTLAVAVNGGDSDDAVSAHVTMGADLSRTISGNGITYIKLDGIFPTNLSVSLTPGGGFDGSVSVSVRNDSFANQTAS